MENRVRAAHGAGLLVLAFMGQALAAEPLPMLGADSARVSVSGLSSGAYMAVQYQVAFSASVVGAGVVAGGPFDCARGSLANAAKCMGLLPFLPPDPADSLAAAKAFAAKGEIDALDNLKTARIYLFSGRKDAIVHQRAVDATASFFKMAGVASGNLLYVADLPAGHALVTPAFGNACPENAPPYINHCLVGGAFYDQPRAIFEHVYGAGAAPSATTTGEIVSFDQREFGGTASGLAETGYVYIPAACRARACAPHVAFHGCKQSAAMVGDAFYARTSYNRSADADNVIVLYPQVDPSERPSNPQGCWDWFGYTGPNYATKAGPQMAAIHAMIARLTSKP